MTLTMLIPRWRWYKPYIYLEHPGAQNFDPRSEYIIKRSVVLKKVDH